MTASDTPRPTGLTEAVLTYGVGDAVLKLASLIALPVFTRTLGPAEYGLYVIALTIASLLQSVLIMGGDSALARLWFATHDAGERTVIAATWLRFSLWTSLAATAAIVLLAPWIGRLVFGGQGKTLVIAAVLLVPVSIASQLAQQILRNRFRPRAFVAVNVLQAVCFLGLGITIASTTTWGAIGLIVAGLVAQLLVLPLRYSLIQDCLRAPTSPRWRRELLAYGLPLVPASLAVWLGTQSDRLLVQTWCTPEQIGWYGAAIAIVGGCQALLVGAFAQAWSPHICRIHGDDPAAAAAETARMLPLIIALLLPVAVSLAWWGPWLVPLVCGQAYAPAAAAMPALALTLLAAGVGQISALGISLGGGTGWFAAIGWTAALIGVACNLIFLPVLGMVAAAWTAALVAWLTVLAQIGISRRYWCPPYPWPRISLLLGFAATLVACATGKAAIPDDPTLPVLATILASIPALALAARRWRAAIRP